MKDSPTEDELRGRFQRHLSWAHDKESAALIWCGYIGGLFEWGLLSADAHKRLLDELPQAGRNELRVLFLDEPRYS